MLVEMRVQGLMLDPITTMPLLVLRDPVTDAKLPIWVAVFEANAIATELERVPSPRPMTHDLLLSEQLKILFKNTRLMVASIQQSIVRKFCALVEFMGI